MAECRTSGGWIADEITAKRVNNARANTEMSATSHYCHATKIHARLCESEKLTREISSRALNARKLQCGRDFYRRRSLDAGSAENKCLLSSKLLLDTWERKYGSGQRAHGEIALIHFAAARVKKDERERVLRGRHRFSLHLHQIANSCILRLPFLHVEKTR